ncbi:Rieske 2Fe-2S domain-containing protein [Rhodococcus sp. NPDC127530]|uniref:aromatic ring-hydroxylating oxygenase subunit alpha n=1 Tax=unclassified Rhodococcus (in: high G+C Gram-positive bacteria) TaxID=192944 RepID=UPI00363AE4BE
MSLGTEDGSLINRHAYFDEEVFEREVVNIFDRSWQFVGHESEIAQPGDYVTRRIVRDEVIVARAEDGRVRVMLNSCRHRGVKLCAADSGNASHFRCGYHGWTYSNDGRLRGVPEAPALYPNGVDRASLGLKDARVAVFSGLIFATFNQDVAPLEEVLGDMTWYLNTVFKKTEYEAYGPPVRAVGEFNWKSGSENWTGDAYHGDVTHHSAWAAGVMSMLPNVGAEMVAEGDPSGESIFVYTVEGGHAGQHQQMPAQFDRYVFPGLEQHLWPEFEENLSETEIQGSDRRIYYLSTCFPNFSVFEAVVTDLGDDLPPVNIINIRVWMPISATETEVWSWLVVPKRATDEWKQLSQRAFARTFNMGGIFELDDFHNWNSTSQANQGNAGMTLDNNYAAIGDEQPAPSRVFPGKVYPGPFHDVQFRSLYGRWAEIMGENPSPKPVEAADVNA